jgi:hypothetical protein
LSFTARRNGKLQVTAKEGEIPMATNLCYRTQNSREKAQKNDLTTRHREHEDLNRRNASIPNLCVLRVFVVKFFFSVAFRFVPEGDGKPIPRIDTHHGEVEIDKLLFGENSGGFRVNLIG